MLLACSTHAESEVVFGFKNTGHCLSEDVAGRVLPNGDCRSQRAVLGGGLEGSRNDWRKIDDRT